MLFTARPVNKTHQFSIHCPHSEFIYQCFRFKSNTGLIVFHTITIKSTGINHLLETPRRNSLEKISLKNAQKQHFWLCLQEVNADYRVRRHRSIHRMYIWVQSLLDVHCDLLRTAVNPPSAQSKQTMSFPKINALDRHVVDSVFGNCVARANKLESHTMRSLIVNKRNDAFNEVTNHELCTHIRQTVFINILNVWRATRWLTHQTDSMGAQEQQIINISTDLLSLKMHLHNRKIMWILLQIVGKMRLQTTSTNKTLRYVYTQHYSIDGQHKQYGWWILPETERRWPTINDGKQRAFVLFGSTEKRNIWKSHRRRLQHARIQHAHVRASNSGRTTTFVIDVRLLRSLFRICSFVAVYSV